LLSMPSAVGLFQRVIAHSPVIGIATAEQHEAFGREFASLAKVEPTVAGWISLNEEQVLDAQFAQAMLSRGIHPMVGSLESEPTAICDVAMGWGPAMDPATIPVAPHQAWADGFNRDVELIVGATADEFMMPPLSPPATAIREWLASVPLSADLKAYTLDAIENGSPDPMGRLATAVMFRRNVLRIAAARVAGGGRTWLYDFQHPSAVTGMAGHCLELPFTWDCLAWANHRNLRTACTARGLPSRVRASPAGSRGPDAFLAVMARELPLKTSPRWRSTP
jgi:para-nitrobenzyl esterase